MGKLPGFLFYPGDWLKDPELRRCSKAEKGMWIDMLAVSFECSDRGVFATGGVPWTDQEIAAAIGGDIAENLECLNELLRKGVARRNGSGAVFSSRMVKDESNRAADKTRKKKQRVREKCPDLVTPHVTPLSVDVNESEVVVALGSKNFKPDLVVGFSLDQFESDTSFQALCKIHPRPEKGHAAQGAYMTAVEREVSPQRPNRQEIAEAIEQAAGVYREMFKRDQLAVVYGLASWLEKGIWSQDPKCWEKSATAKKASFSDGY